MTENQSAVVNSQISCKASNNQTYKQNLSVSGSHKAESLIRSNQREVYTDSWEENMDLAAFISWSTVSCSLIFTGLLLNGFILTKNAIWWLKGQTLQTVDIIITSLGMVRIILLFFCLYSHVEFTIKISLKVLNGAAYAITVIRFVMLCSLRWGTVLGVFYCVKISTYSNRLFMRLKMHISRMVPRLLLMTMVVAFLSSLPNIWYMNQEQHREYLQDNNSSDIGTVTMKTNLNNVFIIFFTGSIFPFLIFCVAIGLLIVSLLKHTINMSSKDSGFTNIQREAHISALCNMFSFLFFYVLNFIGSNLLLFGLRNPSYIFISQILVCTYPSLHSIVLIANNGKLKRSFLAALHCAGASH